MIHVAGLLDVVKNMKNSIEKNLDSMGFSLPKKIKVAGSYIPFLKEDNFLFVSGQLPMKDNKLLFSGKINNNLHELLWKGSVHMVTVHMVNDNGDFHLSDATECNTKIVCRLNL